MIRAIELFRQGGPIMWPLLVCAVLAVAVMLERFISINRAAANTEELTERVRELLVNGQVNDALELCQNTPGPIPALLANGIRTRDLDSDSIERSMEELALRETPLLYKRLGVLDTVITVAPLLGLLGTITGMMSTFSVISTAGQNNATAITGGIGEALIATACGLAIAIITLVGYNYLTEKVKEIIADMEIRATQLMNILVSLRNNDPAVGLGKETHREVAASRA
ncbi:MAG: MotA/TolQ/ExbB proton channel family protein [Cytophagales bacterium]|nr:MotA/TolQ/ExbB proton channel family protein [Armatimonadota bacterium]